MTREPSFKCYAGTEYIESRVALSILDELAVIIQEGVDTHRLQLNPHLTLLEDSFYHSRLKPLLVQWMVVRCWASLIVCPRL